ncbi:hypothetical protein X731_02975 [Mesorhizobium sp. L2C054A000]|nr:hypothetical protein X731_02975 [Mesorhizobium sp. L2C054A000]
MLWLISIVVAADRLHADRSTDRADATLRL